MTGPWDEGYICYFRAHAVKITCSTKICTEGPAVVFAANAHLMKQSIFVLPLSGDDAFSDGLSKVFVRASVHVIVGAVAR